MFSWFNPKINLVQFGDESYGVRRGKKYVSLQNIEFTHSKTSKYFDYCQGTKEKAIKIYNLLTKKDKIIL